MSEFWRKYHLAISQAGTAAASVVITVGILSFQLGVWKTAMESQIGHLEIQIEQVNQNLQLQLEDFRQSFNTKLDDISGDLTREIQDLRQDMDREISFLHLQIGDVKTDTSALQSRFDSFRDSFFHVPSAAETAPAL